MTDADIARAIAGRARPPADGRRRRPDLRRRAAVQPERPRVPARAGPAASQAELWVDRTAPCTSPTRDQRAGHRGHPDPGRRPAAPSSCAPTSPTSARAVKASRLRRREPRGASTSEAPARRVEAEIAGGRTGPADRSTGPSATLPGRRAASVPLVDGRGPGLGRAEMLRRARRFVTVAGTTGGTPSWSSAAG